MRIGIVTPAYDVAPFIGDAITSVLAQTHLDWRMVVVDDGSHDATLAAASAFSDPRLQVVRQPHRGVSAARNHGIAALAADAWLLLDADDWLVPNALTILARTLEAAPQAAAAVGGYIRVFGRDDPPRRARPPPNRTRLDQMLVRNPFANGGHLLIRREAAAAAGPFRTDLHYGEDWEYWIRIRLQGEFVTTSETRPLCCVRERPGSAYLRMADDPGAAGPCLQALFTNPDLRSRIGEPRLAILRRRAEAENAWVVGRELIRHGRTSQGIGWLRRSITAAPSVKRIALATCAAGAGWLPADWRGPFRPYPRSTGTAA